MKDENITLSILLVYLFTLENNASYKVDTMAFYSQWLCAYAPSNSPKDHNTYIQQKRGDCPRWTTCL